MTVHRALGVLICLLALAFAACGGDADPDDTSLLARSEAQRLDERVSRIGQLADEGRCDAARDNLRDYAFRVEQLSERRDPELRSRLREGATNLERTLARQCDTPEQVTTETTETTEPETEPAPTTTEAAPVEPTPTVETQPVEPAPEPVPTPTPEEQEGGAGDEGGGGNGNGGGNGGNGNGNGGGGGQVVPDDSGGAIAPGDDG